MKVLIWIGCFWIAGIISAIIENGNVAIVLANKLYPYDLDARAITAGIIAAIISVSLLYVTWRCAKALCKAWDNRPKKEKASKKENSGSTAVSDNHKCRKCGTELPEGSSFCNHCGTKIRKQKQRKSAVQYVLISISVVCTISLLVFAASCFLSYNNAILAMDNQHFIAAKRHIDNVPFAQRLIPNEYGYISAGVLMEEGKYFEALSAFDTLEGVSVPVTLIEELAESILAEDLYWELKQYLPNLKKISLPASTVNAMNGKLYVDAQQMYRNGGLWKAKEYFSELGDYKRSEDYIMLIRGKLLHDTNYYQLCNLIGFEDTNDIILSNYPEKFLEGEWKTKSKSNYFELIQDDDGYHCSYNLPATATGKYYYLDDGIYSVGNTEEKAKDCFALTVVDMDTITVFCYKNKETYTLYRQ